ncbi:MAG: hypothetical protein QGH33_16210 [Pirellulaceae bacterium]|nr:hypothetical protein [Pirellulaceae bacterium]
MARWTTKQGKIRSVLLNEAGDRVVVESDKYVISYTTHDGKRRYVLGCADLPASKRIAAKLEATEAEYKHGGRDAQRERMGAYARSPISEHLQDLENNLVRAGRSERYIETVAVTSPPLPMRPVSARWGTSRQHASTNTPQN